jgi:hypothetical protein
MSNITYENYSDSSFVVRVKNEQGIEEGGKDHMYHKIFVSMGGRWYSNLRIGGGGWTVPKASETRLKKFIESLKTTNTNTNTNTVDNSPFKHIQDHSKSRKEQHKYHRAVSDSEEDEDIKSAPPKVVEYCKKFAEDPGMESQASSDESYYSNSSAGFPQHTEPIKRSRYEQPIKSRRETYHESPQKIRRNYYDQSPRRKIYYDQPPPKETYYRQKPELRRDTYDQPRYRERAERVERGERVEQPRRREKMSKIEEVSRQIKNLQNMLADLKDDI